MIDFDPHKEIPCVTIEDNATGQCSEIRVQASPYMWVYGNYACDCNRGLLFNRSGGNMLGLDDVDTAAFSSALVSRCPCGEERYRIVAPRWLAEMDAEVREGA